MNSSNRFNPEQSSRKLDDLIVPAQIRALNFIHACKQDGIDLLVTCTYRSPKDQDALYARGRTAPASGPVVTNARAGDSLHQYRVALDVVPLRDGKPVWGTSGKDGELWQRIGELGEESGLEWAGRWTRFREFPHFQYTGGLTLAEFRAGKVPA